MFSSQDRDNFTESQRQALGPLKPFDEVIISALHLLRHKIRTLATKYFDVHTLEVSAIITFLAHLDLNTYLQMFLKPLSHL